MSPAGHHALYAAESGDRHAIIAVCRAADECHRRVGDVSFLRWLLSAISEKLKAGRRSYATCRQPLACHSPLVPEERK